MSRKPRPVNHGTRYAYNIRKCRCAVCVQAIQTKQKQTSGTPLTHDEAAQWQGVCRDIYGIGTKVQPFHQGYEVVHDPRICCGKNAHTSRRAHACEKHQPFGRSPFCAECTAVTVTGETGA